MIKTSDVPHEVIQICQVLANNGHRGWVVGGCTRDMLLGKAPHDWDIATDATPDRVIELFEHTIPTGLQHGTVTVRLNETSFEVTTFRSEGTYSDGRRPDEVKFETSIEADLSRRDFTMNAIALDPLNGEIADPFHGVADLFSRTIRAVRDPDERFQEDGLRPLRAARFASTLNFDIERQTFEALGRHLDTFRCVSAERVHDELIKIMQSRAPSIAIKALIKSGLMNEIMTSHKLRPFWDLDDKLNTLNIMPNDVVLRVACLLWFYDISHEETIAWLERFKFTNDHRDRVISVLDGFYFSSLNVFYFDDTEARKWCHRVGRDMVIPVLEFTRSIVQPRPDEPLPYNMGLIKGLLPTAVLSVKELAVSGNDLINALGMKPGKAIGMMLNRLLDMTLVEPELNDRDTLLRIAQEELHV